MPASGRKTSIGVTLLAERDDAGSNLLIKIEDDGPGLTEEEAQKVLRRGVRLDEKTPGSGLGLDIVKELVDVYGGSLQLKRSVLGGLLCELRLPAAKVGGLPHFRLNAQGIRPLATLRDPHAPAPSRFASSRLVALAGCSTGGRPTSTLGPTLNQPNAALAQPALTADDEHRRRCRWQRHRRQA